MLKNYFFKLLFFFQFLIFINGEVKACNDYPYESGLKVSKNKENLIINSTAEVNIFIDDSDEIQDAYLEAENIAITNIAKYLQTKVNLNQKKNQIKESINNDSREDQKKFSSIDTYDIESQGYLSGIKIIDKCYKKKDYVRVTVILDQTESNEVKSLKSDLIKSILNSE